MPEGWFGRDGGIDGEKWARLLRRAHETALRTGRTPSIVRDIVAASWARCVEAGVDPGAAGVKCLMGPDEAAELWDEHPLAGGTEILRSVLGDLLHDGRHVVAVSDADGCLLWSDGRPDVLRAAEAGRLTPGHVWSEAVVGTNGVGTALAAGQAVQIFSAEHFRSAVHGWQCCGAPVHDPDTGRLLGAIVVTGNYRTAHPYILGLVTTAARLIEEQMRREVLEEDARLLGLFADHAARHGGPAAVASSSGRILAATPAAWTSGRIDVARADVERILPDGTSVELLPLGDGLLLSPRGASPRRVRRRPLRLEVLGLDRARLTASSGTRWLTARHSEFAVVLALHPGGLNSRQLAALVYDAPGHEASVRAELHRLRGVLGAALETRPYRLGEIDVDLVAVQRLLDRGRSEDAAERSRGPLLPGSSVVAIVQARQRLAEALAPSHPGASTGLPGPEQAVESFTPAGA